MTKAYGIEIILFHQLKIFPHQLLCHIMSRLGIMLMNIHSFKFNRLSIHQQYRIRFSIRGQLLRLHHLETTETNMRRNNLRYLPIHLHRHFQPIKIRMFGTPCGHFRDCRLERDLLGMARAYPQSLRLTGDLLSGLIRQMISHLQLPAFRLMITSLNS